MTPKEAREYRENVLGMTRETLSKRTGVPADTIKNWETGKRPMKRFYPMYIKLLGRTLEG